ncbi:MAG: hypothetical protein LIO87_02835, partial [Eubacterium sp.]|nr:hypothetical protein [Eubacterium sp.]
MLLTAVNILITIIAAIFAAAVLLLIAVFFAPLSYEAGGTYKDKPDFNIGISWLFGLVKIEGHLGAAGLKTDIASPFKNLKEKLDKKSSENKKGKIKKKQTVKSAEAEHRDKLKIQPESKPKAKPNETARTKTKPSSEKQPEKAKISEQDGEKPDYGL